jgi:hypothetical protein
MKVFKTNDFVSGKLKSLLGKRGRVIGIAMDQVKNKPIYNVEWADGSQSFHFNNHIDKIVNNGQSPLVVSGADEISSIPSRNSSLIGSRSRVNVATVGFESVNGTGTTSDSGEDDDFVHRFTSSFAHQTVSNDIDCDSEDDHSAQDSRSHRYFKMTLIFVFLLYSTCFDVPSYCFGNLL